MRISPTTAKLLAGFGGFTGNISIDGVVPAALTTVTGGDFSWLDDTTIVGPADTGSGFKIYQFDGVSVSLFSGDGANIVAAGNGKAVGFLVGTGVRFYGISAGPLSLSGMGD